MTNATPITIPAAGGGSPGDPYPSTITMAGLTGPVCRVVVTLHGFQHTWPGDVDILLVAPNGQTCVVMSDAGLSSSVSNITLVFDDNGPTVPTPIVSGTYRPTDIADADGDDNYEAPAPAGPYGMFLDGFNGMSAAAANGDWKLFVRDDVPFLDEGAITGGWTLSITPGIVVTNTNTSGPGSLRQAILDANANPDLSFICFNIPGAGPHTISPGTGTNSLPTITAPVVIDGLTQPGALCDGTWPPTITIILDGTSAGGGANGLNITAGGSTVRGLQIQNFPMDGIRLATNDGNTVQSCFLLSNGRDGVYAEDGSDGNLIGVESKAAATACQGNLISGNARAGVMLDTAANIVAGNFIGTTADGMAALGNLAGVRLDGDCNLVGTNADAFADDLERNIISGNATHGIIINQSEGNVIAGNSIGVGADGTTALGNGTMGTHNGVSFTSNAPNNRVGARACTPDPVEGNIIAFNAGNGIDLTGGGNATIRNAFLMNSIHSNGGLGICFVPPNPTPNDFQDVDIGGNMRQNHPVITSADGATIDGTLNSRPNFMYRLEFFANAAADPSGYGEGETFVTATVVQTDANGDAAFSVPYTPVSGKPYITATATNIGRVECDPPHEFCLLGERGLLDPEIYNTSEFSELFQETVIVCGLNCADIEVFADPDTCETDVDFGQIVPEQCLIDGYFLECTIDDGMGGTTPVTSGSPFPVGTTIVTCILRDPLGNEVDNCSFEVMVIDVSEPTIICPDEIQATNEPGQCGREIDFTPQILGPCDSGAPVVDLVCAANGQIITSPHFFPVGTTVVQCCIYPTALGTDGEPGVPIDCCTFIVTVTDNEPPVTACLTDPRVLVTGCDPIVLTGDDLLDGGLAGITDNCCTEGFSVSISPDTFVCPPLNVPVSISVTVTDCNNNSYTCATTVTFVGPDCNENGLSDYCDICSGYSLDCNDNWVPDECECYWCQGEVGGQRGPAPIPDENAQLSHVGGGAPDGARVADDFYLEPGCVHRISAFRGRLLNNSLPQLRRARLEFYEDCDGKPASAPFATFLSVEHATIISVQPAQDGFYDLTYRFDLCDQCLWLDGGRTYWVSLVGLSDNITDDLSYWVAADAQQAILGSVPCKADGTRISWTQWTWGPWENIDECCIGCVNFEFCLDGYRCPIIWDNGRPDLGAGRGGSASGAHQAGETRSADSFITKSECRPDAVFLGGGSEVPPVEGICPGEQEICLIEAWIWTNCDPVHGFIELYRDLPCGPPELENTPFVVYSGDQIEATRFNETWVANNQTHRLWRLRVKRPDISLCYCTNYWISAGAYSTGSFVVNSYFANAIRGCDPCAAPHAFRITPGQFRSIRPQSTQWADVNPKRDFAFRIAGRDPGMILTDSQGPGGGGRPDGPFGSPACVADANQDGQVTVDDIFAFLSAWFAGCP